jgi:hypothetical protein
MALNPPGSEQPASASASAHAIVVSSSATALVSAALVPAKFVRKWRRDIDRTGILVAPAHNRGRHADQPAATTAGAVIRTLFAEAGFDEK